MEDGSRPQTAAFLSRCVSIDLEVDPNGERIKSIAAIRRGKAKPFLYNRGSLAHALDEQFDLIPRREAVRIARSRRAGQFNSGIISDFGKLALENPWTDDSANDNKYRYAESALVA